MTWKQTVQICASLGAIAALVWTGMEITDWFERPQVKLVGTIGYGPIIVTPDDERSLRALGHIRDGTWITEATKAAGNREGSETSTTAVHGRSIAQEAQSDLVAELRSALKRLLPPDTPVQRPGGYCYISVRNEGSQSAADVRVSVPDALFMLVGSDDPDENRRVINGSTAVIGNMPPLNSVDVVALLRSDVCKYTLRDIRLTHMGGIGRTQVDVDVPSGILSNPVVILLLVGCVALVATLIVALMYDGGWRLLRVPRGRDVYFLPREDSPEWASLTHRIEESLKRGRRKDESDPPEA